MLRLRFVALAVVAFALTACASTPAEHRRTWAIGRPDAPAALALVLIDAHNGTTGPIHYRLLAEGLVLADTTFTRGWCCPDVGTRRLLRVQPGRFTFRLENLTDGRIAELRVRIPRDTSTLHLIFEGGDTYLEHQHGFPIYQ